MVVRRADTTIATTAATSGYFNIQVSGCAGDPARYVLDTDTSGGLHAALQWRARMPPITGAPAAKITPFYQRIYYVSTCSGTDCSASGADSIPTLKRIDITPSGASDAEADCRRHREPANRLRDRYDGSSGRWFAGRLYEHDRACGDVIHRRLAEWQNVMAVRIHVLARNLDTTGSFTDTKTYALGPVSVTPGGAFRRHAYNELVRLNNPAGRQGIAMMNSRTRQSGIALVIGMIMLVLLTLLVISAINSGSVNLRITSNMQAQDEARAVAAAGDREIRQQLRELLSDARRRIRTSTTTSTTTAAVDYKVSVAAPVCKGAAHQIPGRSIDCENGVKSGLFCWDTLVGSHGDRQRHEDRCVAESHARFRAHVFARFHSVFSRLLARSGRKEVTR